MARPRRAGRAILLDDDGRVLLIRFVIPRSDGPFAFWATPGGGQEGDESDLDTARREMREELGLEVELRGPVHSVTAEFEFGREIVEQTDVFFAGRYHGEAPALSGIDDVEREALKTARWWTAEEIERAQEPVFPVDLAALIKTL